MRKETFSYTTTVANTEGAQRKGSLWPLSEASGRVLDIDKMPAKGDPLTDAQIATLKSWIDEGANWSN